MTTQFYFYFQKHDSKIPGNVRKVHCQSSKQKYKTGLDVAECLDVKRLLRMQTPVFVFQTVTK